MRTGALGHGAPQREEGVVRRKDMRTAWQEWERLRDHLQHAIDTNSDRVVIERLRKRVAQVKQCADAEERRRVRRESRA